MVRVAGRPRGFVRAAAFVMLTLNVWRALINDEQITPAQAAAAIVAIVSVASVWPHWKALFLLFALSFIQIIGFSVCKGNKAAKNLLSKQVGKH